MYTSIGVHRRHRMPNDMTQWSSLVRITSFETSHLGYQTAITLWYFFPITSYSLPSTGQRFVIGIFLSFSITMCLLKAEASRSLLRSSTVYYFTCQSPSYDWRPHSSHELAFPHYLLWCNVDPLESPTTSWLVPVSQVLELQKASQTTSYCLLPNYSTLA